MGGDSMMSSGSSVSSGSVRRRKNLTCTCGAPASLVTTRSNENGNFGRRFYGCGRFKEFNRKQCDFFVWHDEIEGNPRDKKVIAGLLRRIEGMKKYQAMLTKCCLLGWTLFVIVFVILIMKMMI